jgi:hypothetical protein
VGNAKITLLHLTFDERLNGGLCVFPIIDVDKCVKDSDYEYNEDSVIVVILFMVDISQLRFCSLNRYLMGR